MSQKDEAAQAGTRTASSTGEYTWKHPTSPAPAGQYMWPRGACVVLLPNTPAMREILADIERGWGCTTDASLPFLNGGAGDD